MTVTIHHTPARGLSSNVFALVRKSGEEPRIVPTPLGMRVCRPFETAIGVVPNQQYGALDKEIVDVRARRLAKGDAA